LWGGRFSIFQFLTSIEWYPTSQSHVRYGALGLIAGTLSVTLLAMVIAVPFGVGVAIYVSEFCGPRVKESLKIVIELLAAIPSVVWGFIGLTVMNSLIIKLFNAPIGLNVLNGGVILALMSVPIIVSIGEDALKAVERSNLPPTRASLGRSRSTAKTLVASGACTNCGARSGWSRRCP
jgi:phosphate transport system permease protein